MTAKKYALIDGVKFEKPVAGQAKIVLDELKRNKNPRLAQEIHDSIDSSKYNTRQDPFRVTLYYILVFKSKGQVKAFENTESEVENCFAGLIPA